MSMSSGMVGALAGLAIANASERIEAADFLLSPNSEPHGLIQSTINDDGIHQSRAQVKSDALTLTSYYPPSTRWPEDFTLASRYENQKVKFDLGVRDVGEYRDLRAAAKFKFADSSELGAVVVDDQLGIQLVGLGALQISEQLRLEVTVDDEAHLRVRSLITQNEYQLSVTVGLQNDQPLVSLSINNNFLWLSGDYIDDLTANVHFVLGNIDKDRGRKVEAYEMPGKNELARFPNIHDAPVGLSLGREPNFLFGGRSFTTFLGKESGDMVWLSDWRRQRTMSSEVGMRFESTGRLREPFLAVGAFYDFQNDSAGMSCEAGFKFNKFGCRVRGEFPQGEKARIGILGELNF